MMSEPRERGEDSSTSRLSPAMNRPTISAGLVFVSPEQLESDCDIVFGEVVIDGEFGKLWEQSAGQACSRPDGSDGSDWVFCRFPGSKLQISMRQGPIRKGYS
jgi:hypothetical protein